MRIDCDIFKFINPLIQKRERIRVNYLINHSPTILQAEREKSLELFAFGGHGQGEGVSMDFVEVEAVFEGCEFGVAAVFGDI